MNLIDILTLRVNVRIKMRIFEIHSSLVALKIYIIRSLDFDIKHVLSKANIM
jgi:hypothetical protein